MNPPTTPDEAFAFTLAAVEELRGHGIRVTIRESGSCRNRELFTKYNQPDRVPSRRWVNVLFCSLNGFQSSAIRQKLSELAGMGILFDTATSSMEWEWQLDWSFRWTGISGDDKAQRKGP